MSPLRNAESFDSLATGAPAVRGFRLLCALAGIMLLCSCSGFRQVEVLDARLLREARSALRSPRTAVKTEIEDGGEKEAPGVGKAILGELLAIFPGIIVPGLGHYYAGDHATGKYITRIGLTGEALMVAGAGVGAGGYFLFMSSHGLDDPGGSGLGFFFMLLGGAAGVAGVPFLASAWFYDMIDTPRAVLSGGQPAPNPNALYWIDPWAPPVWERDEP